MVCFENNPPFPLPFEAYRIPPNKFMCLRVLPFDFDGDAVVGKTEDCDCGEPLTDL
jgi:hypothetical protein